MMPGRGSLAPPVIGTLRRALWAAALGVSALAVLASPASAAKPCAERIIDDWWDNGRVDRVYPIHCYREAIAALPEDLAVYSSAADEIRRALQQRLRDQSGDSG